MVGSVSGFIMHLDKTYNAVMQHWLAYYCKTLIIIIRAHLIFAKFANSLKSRN